MSKFTDAATTLKKAAVKYEALMQAAQVLESIGSLENTAKEYTLAAEAALRERDSNLDEMVKVKAQVKKAKEDGAEALVKTNQAAAQIIANAEADVTKALAASNFQAGKIRTDAETQAAQTIAGINGQMSVLQVKRDDLLVQINSLQTTCDKLTVDADAAEKRLGKVREAIAKLSM